MVTGGLRGPPGCPQGAPGGSRGPLGAPCGHSGPPGGPLGPAGISRAPRGLPRTCCPVSPSVLVTPPGRPMRRYFWVTSLSDPQSMIPLSLTPLIISGYISSLLWGGCGEQKIGLGPRGVPRGPVLPCPRSRPAAESVSISSRREMEGVWLRERERGGANHLQGS